MLLARLPLPAPAFGSRADFIRVLRANHIRYGTARERLKFGKVRWTVFTPRTFWSICRNAIGEDLLLRIHKWLKPFWRLARHALPDLRRFARAYLDGVTNASQFVWRHAPYTGRPELVGNDLRPFPASMDV